MSKSGYSDYVLEQPGESIYIREVYGKTLVELGASHGDLVVLDADLTVSTKTNMFGKEYPDRFFTMGVSEQDMMATAAGFALAGKRPFASTFAVFATGRAWEHVRQSVAFPNLNVKIVATHAGVTVGEDGATHQALEDICLMRVLPNMRVVVPADAVETEQVIRTMADNEGPAYVRLARAKFPTIYNSNYKFELGKASRLKDGSDVGIFAAGIMVNEALQAGKILEERGIDACVVNLSTIKPIDIETVVSVAEKTGAVVTAEEHNIIGGLGGVVSEVLSEHCPTPLKRIGMQDRFGTSGNGMQLLEYFGLKGSNIAEAAMQLVGSK
ncbi:MAG: transketolase family protein [Candidatus Dadabacteria bacterium]|nr:transketolase family protein [Candidatus Dadabacteria bacterium]NIS10156.1 transketolase family protein [Candidatus Dadabacteria bacterium]NIY23070.1 transketolase family protein [Candidatus Dadabacteria bacterium]